jgi:hypothetical protein
METTSKSGDKTIITELSLGKNNKIDNDNEKKPATTTTSATDVDNDDEPAWELIKVLNETQIVGSCPILCSSEHCRLKAAVVYVSSAPIPEKWYSCLDCQVRKSSVNYYCFFTSNNCHGGGFLYKLLLCTPIPFIGLPDFFMAHL